MNYFGCRGEIYLEVLWLIAPASLVRKPLFPPGHCVGTFVKIRGAYLYGSMSQFSILFTFICMSFLPTKPHCLLFKHFICFLGRKEEREKERERNIDWLPLAHPFLGTWPATKACALTRFAGGRSAYWTIPARTHHHIVLIAIVTQ